jgi:hypothetical protein
MNPLYPECGYFQVREPLGKVLSHRYLTDFGYVELPGKPTADDAAFLKKMQAFAMERWEAGESEPFKWEGPL